MARGVNGRTLFIGAILGAVFGFLILSSFSMYVSHKFSMHLVGMKHPGLVSYFTESLLMPERTLWVLSFALFGAVVGLVLAVLYSSRTRTLEELEKARAARKKYSEQLEQMVEKRTRQLKKANELKDLFTDIIRHDLQSPLTVIGGIATLMEEDESQPEKLKELDMIKRNVEKMEGLIDASSKLSRLAGGEKLDFEERDINTILRGVVKDFEPLLKENRINIVYRAEGERLAHVHTLIEDVFANLLSNAVKYSPPGSTVTIDILDEGEAWKVMVADQGEGVPDEYKETIFSRFETGGKKGVKGTGLGLAIVKRIIDLHRGKIWVEDNPGGGSVFIVELPKA